MLTIHGVAVTTRGAAAGTIRGVAATIRGAAEMKVPQSPSLRLSRILISDITSYCYDAPCTHSFIRGWGKQNRRKR